MYRTLVVPALSVLVVAAGCRCWDPPCGQTMSGSGSPPCRLVGSGKPISENCYDAVTGAPVPCPPPGSAMVIPGGYQPGLVPQAMPPANELPPPGETIPPTSIPNAQPIPAPGFGATIAPGVGQPVKR